MASEANAAQESEHLNEVRYEGPAGGWGNLWGVARIFGEEWPTPMAIETLARQNKPHGFVCVSCGWGRPAHPHPFEFCENGAKATLWELTTRRCTPEFFAWHTVTELKGFKDYDLEQEGRLTHPMRYDADADHYVPCGWDEDGVERQVDGLKVTPFSLPDGCVGAYYPEMNPLVPLWSHDAQSKTPAAKSVPVRIRAAGE